MRTKKLAKRGNALIPAIFLLMFIAIFGAVLLRGAFLSITVSARIVSVRQAETLAKSGTDYICDTLFGDQNTKIFKVLDESLEKYNTAIIIPLEINSEKLNVTIERIFHEETATTITDEYIVKTNATYRGQKGACARKMSSIREKSGLGDDKVIGTVLGSKAASYDIRGDYSKKAKIIGPVRVENGLSFQCQDYEIDGDLYVNASHTIHLINTKINGNLYLQMEVEPSQSIILENVTVDGDIIIFSKGTVAFNYKISCKNIYINASSLNAFFSTINADNIYLAKDTLSDWLPAGYTGNVIKGTEGASAVDAKRQNSENIKIDIKEPSTYDITLEGDTINEFNDKVHDLSNGKTLNVDVGLSIHDSTLKNIKVTGDGTMNLWFPKKDAANLSTINIVRESGDAVINFVSLSENANVALSSCVLNANIINPHGSTDLNSARVQGVIISQKFQFYPTLGASGGWDYVNIDTTVGWANTGGLPGIGEGSITYKYDRYI